MKQRGTANARHTAYIRQDWLDQLGMSLPTTKEELGEYLYAVKEAGLGIPWAMSGRTDTEKMYLNFVGSYVDLKDTRDAYIYSEAYMAVAPGSEDGLRQLNQWYNDGLITQDFPTDTAEDVFLADVANGNVGFVLDDTTHIWDSTAVLNTTLGVQETFVPVQCFDLSDGSYRTPFEYRYAMFVMVPATTSEDKLEACMKYLNWMADPEIAVQIRYTPDLTYNDLGVAVEPTSDAKDAAGYPGTCDDLCIMNLNFDWVNDYDVMSESNYQTQEQPWATVDWYKNYYDVCNTGKFIFPSYGYISEPEATYGADIKTRMIEFVYTVICCPSDQFDATYEKGYNELVNAGLQQILDARAEYYDSIN
jgi:ABC-type glycerol-3-phosphate transport system substrate-binding protein